MVIHVAVSAGREEAAYKAIQEEIGRMKSAPINYHDLRSARNAATGSFEISNQARSEQIRSVVENVLAGKGLDGFHSFGNNLQAVSEEEFREVAGRIFNMEKAVIIRVRGQSN